MPPQTANFAIAVVREVFETHGIYVLEEFPDGQIMWGNEPISNPYRGIFHMADYFIAGRYDIFTVRAIVNHLDKAGDLRAIEDALFSRIHEGEDG